MNSQKAVLYALGGMADFAIKSVSRYDPETDSWDSSCAEIPCPRTNFGCVSIGNDIFVIGGYDGDGFNGDYQATMLVLDTGNSKWSELPPMKYKRQGCGAACSADGKYIYVAGGLTMNDRNILSVVERFSVDTHEWTMVKPMSEARSNIQLVQLGGYLYALGGFGNSDDSDDDHDDDKNFINQRYDPETDQWSPIAPMKHHEYSILGAAALDGKIYVLGPQNNFEMYSPEEDRWTELPVPELSPLGRRLVALNGELFAVGGAGAGGFRYHDELEMYVETTTGAGIVHSFDVEKQIWSRKADLEIGRTHLGVAVVSQLLNNC